jgi:LysM repeat protein
MSLQAKYSSVLTLGQEIGVKNGALTEANGVLTMFGTVETPHEKNLLWDKIKASGGAKPSDIIADIKVTNETIFAKYTVQKGDTLGKISKAFYGEASKYNQIFQANTNILRNADSIEVGQKLIIPHDFSNNLTNITMSLQAKYSAVLALGQELGAKNGAIVEDNGVLKMSGTVETPHEKNLLWDKIKAAGGANPTDIIADIRVENEAIFAKYTVQKGDTLGKISKAFYGEASKYNQIFKANTNILRNADSIEVGQELIIPHE